MYVYMYMYIMYVCISDMQFTYLHSYHALLEKSVDVITEPSMFATPLLSFRSRERMYLECPVNLACRFFCCQVQRSHIHAYIDTYIYIHTYIHT